MFLLRCFGRALARNALKIIADAVPFGSALVDVARDAWSDYHQNRQPDELPADIQALAQSTPAVAQQEASAIAHQEAAAQPARVQQALADCLAQVPALIRRSLRRPSDPSGKTFTPTLSLRRAEDLIAFLPPQPPRFKIGDRPLGNAWELDELLGIGGFGEVWRAHQPGYPGIKAALKFCLDAAATRSLLLEAGNVSHVLNQRHHAGIVRLQKVHEGDPLCLEYEYVEGGDLCGLIRELHEKDAATSNRTGRLLLQLAETMAFVHKLNPPLVHRDLKPANILVERQDDGEYRLRIADFGISASASRQAIRAGASEATRTVGIGGHTPLYASPQQIAGERPDPRDDVHALGVIWYQLLTGDLKLLAIPPDWRDEAEERGLDDKQIEVMASCLSSRAEKRPGDAAELSKRLTSTAAPSAPLTTSTDARAGKNVARRGELTRKELLCLQTLANRPSTKQELYALGCGTAKLLGAATRPGFGGQGAGLLGRGLITHVGVRDGSLLYEITQAGRGALAEAMGASPSEPIGTPPPQEPARLSSTASLPAGNRFAQQVADHLAAGKPTPADLGQTPKRQAVLAYLVAQGATSDVTSIPRTQVHTIGAGDAVLDAMVACGHLGKSLAGGKPALFVTSAGQAALNPPLSSGYQ